MKPVDVMLIQHALRDVEKALEALKSDDALALLRAKLDLIWAAGELRAALVGNVEGNEKVYGPDEAPF